MKTTNYTNRSHTMLLLEKTPKVLAWLVLIRASSRRLLRNFVISAATLLGLWSIESGTVTYQYDSSGRLMSAHYAGGQNIGYTYDSSGNIAQIVNSTSNDSDGDGMDDAWEMQYFKSLARTGSADLDGDGFPDLSEYLAGTLPDDPSSSLRIVRTDANTELTITWTAVAGKTYRVFYKTSLSDLSWQPLNGDVIAAGNTASKTDPDPAILPRRYYKVTLVP